MQRKRKSFIFSVILEHLNNPERYVELKFVNGGWEASARESCRPRETNHIILFSTSATERRVKCGTKFNHKGDAKVVWSRV